MHLFFAYKQHYFVVFIDEVLTTWCVHYCKLILIIFVFEFGGLCIIFQPCKLEKYGQNSSYFII